MLAVQSAGTRRAAPIPARAGVGLKPEHMTDIMQSPPEVGWFEVHAENYMGAGGRPIASSNGCASVIRFPCTALASLSAGLGRSTERTSAG